MAKLLNGKIEGIQKLTNDTYRISINSEYIAKNAKPGQFVNIKCCKGFNTLLRRPVSIHDVDVCKGCFDIIFRVQGKGTMLLSLKNEHSELDIMGPLGNGFDLSERYKKIAVVGGGIGIFPLYYILRCKDGTFKKSFLGFADKDRLILRKEFGEMSDEAVISTEDGSIGHKGFVTDILEEDLKENNYDIIYTCGPSPMLKTTAKLAEKYGVKCQISLEQRMGCGIGACLVCSCKTVKGSDWKYSRVCKDGPVFWSSEVIFD